MKVVIGVGLGFLSGFLIYLVCSFTFLGGGSGPSPLFVLTTFVGAWVASSWWLIRGAKTVSKVFSRGFLLGAAEWMAMIPAGMIASGRALAETVEQGDGSGAEAAGAAIGAGLFATLSGGFSIGMTLVCLLGFGVSHFLGREMGVESTKAQRHCPECDELVSVAARRCKHCGADIEVVQ